MAGITPLGDGRIAVSLPTWGWSAPFTPPGGPWLPPAQGAVGWHVNKSTATPDLYGAQYALGNMPGLALWLTGSHNQDYNPGYAEWVYSSPGTTKVASASMTQSWRDKIYRADHCTEIGLRNGSEKRATDYHCNPPEGTDQGDGWYKRDLYLEDPSATPTAKEVFFKLKMPDCKNPPRTAEPSCSKNTPPLDPITNGWTTRLDRVDLVLTDDDLPTVEARPTDPQIVDVDGRSYVNGRTDVTVAVAGKDAGSGVKHVGITKLGGGEIVGSDAPCDPTHNTPTLDARICPAEFSQNLFVPVASTPYDEARHSFSGSAIDVANNAAVLAYWDIFVDRTPPPPPHEIRAEWDEDKQEISVGWKSDPDPNLADGSLGSGVDQFHFRYRLTRPVDGYIGEWSAWKATDEAGFVFPSSTADWHIEVVVHALDSVGNVSSPALAIVPVSESPCDPQTDNDYSIGGPLHLGGIAGDPTVDSFTFSSAMNAEELNGLLPVSARVRSLLSHQRTSSGDSFTGGAEVVPGTLWRDAAKDLKADLYDTAADTADLLMDMRTDASDSFKRQIDTELGRINDRLDGIDALDGAPIISVAIDHDPEVAAEILLRAGSQVTVAEVPVVDPLVECDPPTQSGVATSRVSVSRKTHVAAVGGATFMPPWVVTMGEDFGMSDSLLDGRDRKVTVLWQWISAKNRSYWSTGPGRRTGDSGNKRGYEVEVQMDQEGSDGQGGSWGFPSWKTDRPPGGTAKRGGQWFGYFNCPYPDDYDGPPRPIGVGADNILGRYPLTVGQGCRPGGTGKIYAWTHKLNTLPEPDVEDRIVASVQPVRWKTGTGETTWCSLKLKRLGSCFFDDPSVGQPAYSIDSNPNANPVLSDLLGRRPKVFCFVKHTDYLKRCP